MKTSYWEEHAKCHPLPMMPRACSDCAVQCGFYADFAQSLSEQPPEIQERCAASWFCHNNPRRSCFGALEYLTNPATEFRWIERAKP